ncbi:Plasma-membrane_choline transporter and transmembrane domain-containing protein [Hexamita inflata]|uniref:Choline transporter-like protein n=1 Tax=Hexamita inflata TaxID=28002 RepID=A0AA86R5F5_9EUKA|nr:Plasma-membrane choline transporter and transmembrane domain-containing protein [Hexamita inflata]
MLKTNNQLQISSQKTLQQQQNQHTSSTQAIKPKKPTGPTQAVMDAKFWLSSTDIRHCRDLFCLLIYLACWGIFFYLAFFNNDFKIVNSLQVAKNYLEPADQMRRICGNSTQDDSFATDYSKLISSFPESVSFCNLFKSIADSQVNNNVVYSTDMSTLQSLQCNSLITGNNYSSTTSYAIYSKLQYIYKDLTHFDTGFVLSSTFCVQYTDLTINASKCSPSPTSKHVCHREMLDVFTFIKTLQISAQDLAIISQINGQFLTQTQFETVFSVLNLFDPNLATVLEKMCEELPSKTSLDYYRIYTPETFKIQIHKKCIMDFQNAIQDTWGSIEMFVVYLQYFSQAFIQPIPTAIQELDLSWKNLLISIGLTIAVTIVYLILMYFFSTFLIYVSMLAVVAGISYFAYVCLSYGYKLGVLNSQYTTIYGQFNSQYQLQEVFFYIAGGLLLIGIVITLSLSCLLWSIARSITKTISVAMNVIKHMRSVLLFPFILMLVCLCHVGCFVYVILMFVATGEFDARLVAFFFRKNISASKAILAFYIFMLIHGLFLCVSLMQFLVGASTAQYYFGNRKKKTQYTFVSVKWMFLQFGSLVLQSFCQMFMVWLRPLFKALSGMEGNGKIKRFALQYISMCGQRSVYAFALTGKSFLKAAVFQKQFIGVGKHIDQSVGRVHDLFLSVGTIAISFTGWFIVKMLGMYVSADIQPINYIWTSIISSFLSYLIASFVTDITQYIFKSIQFCWSYEKVIGQDVIQCEPEDFKELREPIRSSEAIKKMSVQAKIPLGLSSKVSSLTTAKQQ